MTKHYIDAVAPLFISIHMPHTWHDIEANYSSYPIKISIHMPHTWHDLAAGYFPRYGVYFNPHATYVA